MFTYHGNKYEKTGASTDELKETELLPIVVTRLLKRFGEFDRPITLADYGSGDGSYFSLLIQQLREYGHSIPLHTRIDVSDDAFLSPYAWFVQPYDEPDDALILIRLDGRHSMDLLQAHRERYDLVLSQLTAHQIVSDAELSMWAHGISSILASSGVFVFVDLHPSYIDYLAATSSSKLIPSPQDGVGVYRYMFDSGGSALVQHRQHGEVPAAMLVHGLVPVHAQDIIVAREGERYEELREHKIPMFQLIEFEKRPENINYEIYGRVTSCFYSLRNRRDLTLILEDGTKVDVPITNSLNWVNPGDTVLLKQATITRANNVYVINLLVVLPLDENRPMAFRTLHAYC